MDRIASEVTYISGIMAATNHYTFELFKRFLQLGSILEVGAAEGNFAEKLMELDAPHLDLLDGSSVLCERLRSKFGNARVFHSLIEDFEPDCAYDNILVNHVLEHVEDPIADVRRIASWLEPKGRLFVAVPNAMSLHRQAAVMMGLLAHEEELNATDIAIGHRRVFNPVSLRRCLHEAGLEVLHEGGYWLKPLSNQQLESSLPNEALAAFLRLGERYPDIAAELYAVASIGPA